LRRIGPALLALLVVLAAGGCASTPTGIAALPSPPPEWSAVTPEKEYRLQPGDVISVTFFYYPRLDTTVQIRPDGHISVALIDDVKAAGHSLPELDHKLTSILEERMENADLTVTLKGFTVRKIFVGGEVRAGGQYDLEPNLTALQAVLRAGGALTTANLDTVVVIRREKTDEPQMFVVDLGAVLDKGKVENVVFLKPFDVVFVPKSAIAKADQFVSQYIDQLLPISLMGGFSYVIGNYDSGDANVRISPGP